MRSQTLGDKADFLAARVRNAEASATIPRGTPVALILNGTDDGLAVVLPSTAGVTPCAVAKYGVALDDILAGQLGEVQLAGICRYAVFSVNTRASSTGAASWSAQVSVASFVVLSINTVNNFFSTKASSIGFASIASTDTLAALVIPVLPDAAGILAQSVASQAASATTTSETRTVITQAVKVFLRMM